jgi:uncharacterized protein (DUF2164 family)
VRFLIFSSRTAGQYDEMLSGCQPRQVFVLNRRFEDHLGHHYYHQGSGDAASVSVLNRRFEDHLGHHYHHQGSGDLMMTEMVLETWV